jgi:MFS transporter, DHA1 family, inner membrane transport protein
MPRLLWLFAFINLIVGSGAFVVGGVLTAIATDLQVGVAAAGQAMTAYALSTALLAPVLMMATGAWPRRRALLLALGLFGTGNVVCALAGNLPVLLAGRVLMGLGAMFTPVAAGIAVALVPPQQRGKALSLTFVGMSLSYVIGVPLGSWLGLATSWQVPVWLFAVLSAGALALVARFAPADIRAPGASFEGVGRLLARRDVLGVLLTTLSYFVAIFVVFSFIGPVLQALVPMDRATQALTLALFGVAGVAGTLTGGLANDRFGSRRTLVVQLTVLGSTMALLPLTQGSWVALVATLMTWGVAGFGMMVPQQSRLAAMAPAQAPLLLSLNTSMLYLGTAAGAIVGGAAAARLGLVHLAWAAVPFVALALAILLGVHTSGPAVPIDREEKAP